MNKLQSGLFPLVALSSSLLLVVGCQNTQSKQDAAPSAQSQVESTATEQKDVADHSAAATLNTAVAQIEPAQDLPTGETVTGQVVFVQQGDTLIITATLSGFKPGSVHGIHIHEAGDLSSHDLSSAKGHFNPSHHHHGGPDDAAAHEGDLGNITADAQGRVQKQWERTNITLQQGPHSVVGRSVLIHGGADDLKTDPAGNSGPRIAGGVIVPQQ